mgnify:CR=1 FL=1
MIAVKSKTSYANQFVFFLCMKIWKIFLERMFGIKEYDEDLSRLASFLPWLTMIEEGIIINKNGNAMIVTKFR